MLKHLHASRSWTSLSLIALMLSYVPVAWPLVRCASQLCQKCMASGDPALVEVGQYTTQMVQRVAQQ